MAFTTRRLFLVAALVAFAAAAGATNGYSPTGFGTANKGLAGAGVALPQDTLAGATNPAGMLVLGDRVDLGVALFNPNRGFTADNNGGAPFPTIPAGTYESANDWFLVPAFGWNHRIDENRSIGVLVGGNGGMNTEYGTAVFRNFAPPGAPPSFVASSPTGVDLAQLFIGVPYAQRVAPGHTLGIMPILAVQRFKAEGLEPFRGLSIDPANVTNNGYDYAWGYGVRLGWLGQLSDRLAVGASVQSRLYMQKFDKYRGLFAEQGGFDVPPTVTAGVSYRVTPEVTLVADWQRIFFSDVKSLSNPNGINPATPGTQLGDDNGLGFGWRDIDILKFGAQWQYSPALTLRAGISHADRDVFADGDALFNILAPATVRTHASLGMSYRIDADSEISFAYTRAFENTITGRNPNFTGPQTGSLQMDQHELEISWTWYLD